MTTLNAPIQAQPLQTALPKQPATAELMDRFARLIYDRTGIRLSQQKQVVLNHRLCRRLGQSGHANLHAYYDHVRRLSRNAPEWNHFLQQVTCHQTHFFRDEEQWAWFRNSYLPQRKLAVDAGELPRRLRIWSAAASTGDEAFTAAICLAEELDDFADWRIEIVGTDLADGPLEQARTAMFGESTIRRVPVEIRQRHFTKLADARIWKANPELATLIEFRQHNLLDRMLGPSFDLILLKNVLIYFDRRSQRKVLRNVLGKLAPAGHLITGPTDGVGETHQTELDLIAQDGWLFSRAAD